MNINKARANARGQKWLDKLIEIVLRLNRKPNNEYMEILNVAKKKALMNQEDFCYTEFEKFLNQIDPSIELILYSKGYVDPFW